MAGRRRGTGRPLRAWLRVDRRRRQLAARLGRACGPVERVTAAAEYARAVLVRLPPAAADQVADQLVEVLTEVVDAAVTARRRR